MISPTELRIGNYITHATGDLKGNIIDEVIKVNGNTIKEIELHPYLGYNGIPLTPEILIRCGFVNVVKDVEWELPDHSFYLVIKHGTTHFRHLHTELKSLHQLQNLYNALTGTELEINL